MPVLVTAALITRDEEQHLPDCLASLAGVVDEIVVVDTGSLDSTPTIARAFGATVLERPWQGDFAAARNAGLDAATGEWILYIDADERLSVDGDLGAALQDPELVAGLVRFRAASAFTPYLEHRMFRNRPDIRFRGAMHETIVPDLSRVMEAEGTKAAPVPAAIEHLGYEGDQMHKHRRNLPLLEREVAEDPDRTYLWYHLGVVRLALDDPSGAEEAWTRAIATSDARDQISNPALLSYVELALHRLGGGHSAADLVATLAQKRRDDPLTSWVMAGQAMHEARWLDAIALLEPLLAIDPNRVLNQELAYNRQIFDARALNALGVCRFQLGEVDEAARLFARAEASDPSNQEYRVKRELAEARAARR